MTAHISVVIISPLIRIEITHHTRNSMRKTALLVIALLALAVPVFSQEATPPVAPVAPPDASAITLTPVASGYTRPLLVTNAGDGSNRLFIVEQTGKIWIVDAGTPLDNPFLDVSGLISPDALNLGGYSERGLLGLAFSPDYENNGQFFINYTDLNGNTVIARYRVSDEDPNVADPNSAVTILTQEQPYANHNGGNLAFGADGYLYIGFGDGGSGGDPENRAQNLSTWLGKILRIDVNNTDLYAVPEDNPFVGQASAAPEVWAYGLRNPWRFSFDAVTGDLYIADVGQNQYEEVNFQPGNSAGGENYGWPAYEATHPYNNEQLANTIMPVAEYPHSQGVSISGGHVYRGAQIPSLQGVYLYADWGSGFIWWLYQDEAGAWQNGVLMSSTGHSVSAFGVDEQNELYLVDYSGAVYRFDPA
jgi:glucose/arabinose dehydrogenase